MATFSLPNLRIEDPLPQMTASHDCLISKIQKKHNARERPIAMGQRGQR